ncbi:hypothetical protein OHV05_36490 (plasmid) [Kitasatospora sp. NBC_00070]
MFYSDKGDRYASREFAALGDRFGVIRLRGAVGTSAAAESFNASMKRETLARSTRRPPVRLPLGHPLQHQETALRPRPTEPDHLRTTINYADHRRMTTGVLDQGESPEVPA